MPDTMVNFLALLGWSLDGETTIITATCCARSSAWTASPRKDAVFDETKLDWMNGQYIKAMDREQWVEALPPVADRSGRHRRRHRRAPRMVRRAVSAAGRARDHLTDAAEKLPYMFWGANVTLDEKSVNKVLKKEGARADEALRACRDILADESRAWECDALQEACRALCEPMDIKPKNMFQPLRVAVCGNMVSPPLFESIELMERADVIARIDAAWTRCFAS